VFPGALGTQPIPPGNGDLWRILRGAYDYFGRLDGGFGNRGEKGIAVAYKAEECAIIAGSEIVPCGGVRFGKGQRTFGRFSRLAKGEKER